MDSRERYLKWFYDSMSRSGGRSYVGFIDHMRRRALDNIPAEEQEALADLVVEFNQPALDMFTTSRLPYCTCWVWITNGLHLSIREGDIGSLMCMKDNPELKGSYYMTLGNEGGAMLAGTWELAGVFEEHGPQQFKWHFELMKEETHGSIPHRSTYKGLEWLYDGWSIDNLFGRVAEGGMEDVDAHYEALSTHFGYEIKTPESIVNQVGYTLLGQERVKEAIAVMRIVGNGI